MAKAGTLGRLATLAYNRTCGRAQPARTVHTYHGHVLSGTFGPRASAAWAALERRLAPRTERLVAVAEGVRDELLLQHRVGRPEQYVVIPPGIDVERTRADRSAGAALRARLGLPPGCVLVGSLGRLAPVKDVERLLAAWMAVRGDPSEPTARLLVVGTGPCEDALRRQAAGRADVLFLPPRACLGDVYGALDALALASRAEGLPQVLVEAMAAGLPVIATRVGGVPGLVREGVDGLLVPAGSTSELAAALARLLHDEALRARLSAGARERRFPEMTADAVAERLASLYHEVLGGR
jgi:glycosyltransferase involved in cell wall biosynthesis